MMHDMSEHSEPVTGLYIEPFPDRVSASQAQYLVLVTTPRRYRACIHIIALTDTHTHRIYEFVGQVQRGDTPQFSTMFDRSGKGMCTRTVCALSSLIVQLSSLRFLAV